MEHEFDCLIQSLQDKKQEFLQTVDDEQNEKYNKLQEQKDLLEKTQNEVEELIKDAESVSTKRSQSAQSHNVTGVQDRSVASSGRFVVLFGSGLCQAKPDGPTSEISITPWNSNIHRRTVPPL